MWTRGWTAETHNVVTVIALGLSGDFLVVGAASDKKKTAQGSSPLWKKKEKKRETPSNLPFQGVRCPASGTSILCKIKFQTSHSCYHPERMASLRVTEDQQVTEPIDRPASGSVALNLSVYRLVRTYPRPVRKYTSSA